MGLLLTMVLEPGATMPILTLLMPAPTLVLMLEIGLDNMALTVPPPITLPSVTTDSATTVLGELPPTLVPGPAIGLEPTVLPLMPEKVSGTPLLMHGLVLSILPPPMVLMTGPPLVLLPST